MRIAVVAVGDRTFLLRRWRRRRPADETRRHVDGVAVAAPGCGRDRRLEPRPDVKDDVGTEDAVNVIRNELEVVRLDARRREAAHADEVAAYPLGGVRDRVKVGDNRNVAVTRGRLRPARGQRQCKEEDGGSAHGPNLY